MFKKTKIALALAAVATSVMLSGCFSGNPNNPDQNYAALKRWNKFNNSWKMADSAEANKWINAILGTIPCGIVYWLCSAGDILIFNSIGFWTGNNPFAVDTYVDENGAEFRVAKTDGQIIVTEVATNECAVFNVSEDGKQLTLAAAE